MHCSTGQLTSAPARRFTGKFQPCLFKIVPQLRDDPPAIHTPWVLLRIHGSLFPFLPAVVEVMRPAVLQGGGTSTTVRLADGTSWHDTEAAAGAVAEDSDYSNGTPRVRVGYLCITKIPPSGRVGNGAHTGVTAARDGSRWRLWALRRSVRPLQNALPMVRADACALTIYSLRLVVRRFTLLARRKAATTHWRFAGACRLDGQPACFNAEASRIALRAIAQLHQGKRPACLKLPTNPRRGCLVILRSFRSALAY